MNIKNLIPRVIGCIGITSLFIMSILCINKYRASQQEIQRLNARNAQLIEELNDTNKTLKNTIQDDNAKANYITNLIKQIQDLNEVIEYMDYQLKEVQTVNQSYVDELTTLRSRSELYDKYEYAIMYNGERTELKYEEIKLGEELMEEKGYDPHLMFGTIMVESHANPTCVNSSSGATGYGQFMDSTAKFVYEDLLGLGTYRSDMRKDGATNIRMMVAYYDYLYKQKGNTFGVIKQYSGNSTNNGASAYLEKINNYTLTQGVVID